mmetsp:Transcript_67737/g.201492  ORF Transcript_67737/g.201492 Transcript_67737/m.201492 type:complete len:443 (-) Transcript_67737:1192-2520(-)
MYSQAATLTCCWTANLIRPLNDLKRPRETNGLLRRALDAHEAVLALLAGGAQELVQLGLHAPHTLVKVLDLLVNPALKVVDLRLQGLPGARLDGCAEGLPGGDLLAASSSALRHPEILLGPLLGPYPAAQRPPEAGGHAEDGAGPLAQEERPADLCEAVVVAPQDARQDVCHHQADKDTRYVEPDVGHVVVLRGRLVHLLKPQAGCLPVGIVVLNLVQVEITHDAQAVGNHKRSVELVSDGILAGPDHIVGVRGSGDEDGKDDGERQGIAQRVHDRQHARPELLERAHAPDKLQPAEAAPAREEPTLHKREVAEVVPAGHHRQSDDLQHEGERAAAVHLEVLHHAQCRSDRRGVPRAADADYDAVKEADDLDKDVHEDVRRNEAQLPVMHFVLLPHADRDVDHQGKSQDVDDHQDDIPPEELAPDMFQDGLRGVRGECGPAV